MEVGSNKPPRFPTAKGPVTDRQQHILTPWPGNRGWECTALASWLLFPTFKPQYKHKSQTQMCSCAPINTCMRAANIEHSRQSHPALVESWQLPLGQSERTTEDKPELHLEEDKPELQSYIFHPQRKSALISKESTK